MNINTSDAIKRKIYIYEVLMLVFHIPFHFGCQINNSVVNFYFPR